MTLPPFRQRTLTVAAVCAGVLPAAAGSAHVWVPFALAAAALTASAARPAALAAAQPARTAARPSAWARYIRGGSPTALGHRSER